jgi:dCTP deaminase
MALSDVEIFDALEKGLIKIDPAPEITDVTEASIDLHLGPIIRHFRPNPQSSIYVDWGKAKANDFINFATDVVDLETTPSFTLDHGHFAIGYTKETVTLSNELLARVEGRSTLARFGLAVHNTAPTIQPGYHGVITLELTNVGTINLQMALGLNICQLILERLGSPAQKPYGSTNASSYQGSKPDRS